MADSGLLVDLRRHGFLMVAEETREGGCEGLVLLLRRGLRRLLSLALYTFPVRDSAGLLDHSMLEVSWRERGPDHLGGVWCFEQMGGLGFPEAGEGSFPNRAEGCCELKR